MDCFFCRRQREDQTSVASVHGRKSEDVPQEGAVSRRIIAVHDHMRTLTTAFESSSAAEAALEDSSEVPQVWRLRSEGSWTSHNGSSVNFLGGRDDSLGDGRMPGNLIWRKIFRQVRKGIAKDFNDGSSVAG